MAARPEPSEEFGRNIFHGSEPRGSWLEFSFGTDRRWHRACGSRIYRCTIRNFRGAGALNNPKCQPPNLAGWFRFARQPLCGSADHNPAGIWPLCGSADCNPGGIRPLWFAIGFYSANFRKRWGRVRVAEQRL